MHNVSYVIFRLQETLFGVESTAVREIIPRLWLSSVEEQRDFVRGIVNLRGEILPVVDLNVCFGRAEMPVALTDRIVVLEWENKTIGVLVQEVCDICTLSPTQLSAPSLVREGTQSLVSALAQRTLVGGMPQLFSVLAIDRLFALGSVSLPETSEPLDSEQAESVEKSEFGAEPLPGVSPEVRAILEQRSQEFAQPLVAKEEFYQASAACRRAAIVALGETLLAIELELIQEFLQPPLVFPMPGMPPCVCGLIRVRGEIVPLVTLDRSLATVHEQESVLVLLNLPGMHSGHLALLADRVLDMVTSEPHAKRLSYQGKIVLFLEPEQVLNLFSRQGAETLV